MTTAVKPFAVLRFGLSLAAVLALYAFCLFALASLTLLAFYSVAVKQDVVPRQQPDEFFGIPSPAAEELEGPEDTEVDPDEEPSYHAQGARRRGPSPHR